MCGIIGAYIRGKPKNINKLLERVFLESAARGIHATGISYRKGGRIFTKSIPVPAKDFPFDFDEYWNEDGNLYLIGHCRYSTSSLKYNQPLTSPSGEASVVHNGVITQEDPELWGIPCLTENDSELLLHVLSEGRDPFLLFPESSISACFLSTNSFVALRNGKRPMWYSVDDFGVVIVSTKDIAERCSLTNPKKMPPWGIYDLTKNRIEIVKHDGKDLQY